MSELERLGRIAAERLRRLAEDAFRQALLALLPLIEQMIQRLTALWELLRLLALIILQLWLQVVVGEAMEPLGQAIGKAVERLVLLTLFGVALVATVTAITVVLVAVLHCRAWGLTTREDR